MRRKIVAGNWKMNTTPAEGAELAKAVAAGKKEICDCVNFIVCPPYTHLSEVVRITRGTGVAVGAQDCATEEKGAFTGEVSARMIASLGVEYVILGHSERRQYYGETSETLAQFLVLYDLMKKAVGKEEAKKHFIATTTIGKGTLYNLAQKEGFVTYGIPAGVGGRFSVLSNVGLVPFAAMGIDIKKLLGDDHAEN